MKIRIWIPVLPAAILVVIICLTSPIRSDTPTEVSVGPPAAEDLLVAAPGVTSPAAAEDGAFGLQGVFRLQGKIHRPNGTPYTQTVALQFLRLDPFPATLVYTTVIVFGGEFEVALPEGLYWLGTEQDLSPFYMPRTNIDLQSDVLGQVVTLLNQRESPVGETPPDASLITVSAPDVDGFATVTGAPGAVPPYSAVAVVNLNAAAAAAATANASGAFTTTTLYAPPGSPLLVKYDLDGYRVVRFWEDAQANDAVTLVQYLNLLPGTILNVGQSSPQLGPVQAFDTAGAFWQVSPSRWAGWWLSGTLQTPRADAGFGLEAVPGDIVTLTADLRITSPGLNCTQPQTFSVAAVVALHQSFGVDGRADPWGMDNHAYLFTPTDLPIDGGGMGETTGVAATLRENWNCRSNDSVESSLALTFTVPPTLKEGTYFPKVFYINTTVPLGAGVPIIPSWFNESTEGYLPPIRVGAPALPRIPWTLLADYPVNGHRGVRAREDVGFYQFYPWIVFPPKDVVIPRLDERTGEPLVYRLEPGANWIAATDRRLPNPPHIPLDLPSGHLTIEVLKPDGTVDKLGPATIMQSSLRTPTTPGGDPIIGVRSGHIGDVYHLATMDDAFGYSFDQYGRHVIFVMGEVNDIYDNTYLIQATYDVNVARVLDLDPAQLPTMPYEQGDLFAPGLHIFPPVPADVTVRLVHMPFSDPTEAIVTEVTGQANRFGYFQPPAGEIIPMTAPGEFRVDITAVYTATDGTLWMGAMTWGNVVEGPAAMMEAHGRRGLDYNSAIINDMPAWFEVDNLPPEKTAGAAEVYSPFWSGDVHWGMETRLPGDSIQPAVTIRDIGATGIFTGPIYDVLKANYPRGSTEFRRPPSDARSYENLVKRMEIGEAPLFITTRSGINAPVAPEEIDQWGYWYYTSQRAGVRVREYLSEDMIGVGYWGFDDAFGYQIGVPANGDQPGDLKWAFGGAVLRTITETSPLSNPVALNEYAIYSSLWVLLPPNDARGARVTPPFQDATGVSINGGPVLTITVEGAVQEIDMLFLPLGVRPGDVLEVGDVVAFSGQVGPPLDSRVHVTITAPSGALRPAVLRANKIGWVYDPGFDFGAEEPGRWTVDVRVVHDRALAYAGVPDRHNAGTVLGTTGRYDFYVVERGSPRLPLHSPLPGFVTWPTGKIEPIHIRGVAPTGTTAVTYTIYDKGVVMGQGSVTPDFSGSFTVTYDAKALHDDFSMLSLTAREGNWEGLADEVTINLLAVGGVEPRANSVTLIGEEVFAEVTLVEPRDVLFLPLILKQD